MYGSKEIAQKEGVSKQIAVRWAKGKNLKRLGIAYLWTEEDYLNFTRRNKKSGRPKL